MNDVQIFVMFCVLAITSLIIYFLIEESRINELSTCLDDFEIAKNRFEEMKETINKNNLGYYVHLIKIDYRFGWNFYYKIKRK